MSKKENTIIPISKETKKQLLIIKASKDFKTLDETINYLIDFIMKFKEQFTNFEKDFKNREDNLNGI